MYKAQMTFQKILCILTLIVGAITFVYALGVMTDVYETFISVPGALKSLDVISTDPESDKCGSIIVYQMQDFNNTLVGLSLGYILIALTLFITCTNTRRKYYISNYISIGATVVYGFIFAIWTMVQAGVYKNKYLTTADFEALKVLSDRYKLTPPQPQTRWFNAGYAIAALVIVISLVIIANLVWKIILMVKENELLKQEGVA